MQMTKRKALRLVLYAFAGAGVSAAAALFLLLGPASTASNGTSVRVLGAALAALGLGAAIAARDPYRHRVLIVIEMVFMALASLALAYRIVFEDKTHDRAWLILPPMLVCLTLLGWLFPRREPAGGKSPPARNGRRGE